MRLYRLPRNKAFAIAAGAMSEKQVLNLEEIWSHDVWESQETEKTTLDFYHEEESDGEDDENYEEDDDQLNGDDEDHEDHEGYESTEHDEAQEMSVGMVWVNGQQTGDRASMIRTYEMQNRTCS